MLTGESTESHISGKVEGFSAVRPFLRSVRMRGWQTPSTASRSRSDSRFGLGAVQGTAPCLVTEEAVLFRLGEAQLASAGMPPAAPFGKTVILGSEPLLRAAATAF
jgi:hypothetical protein